jgi:putative sigma-54 modulation protein
MKVSDHLRSVIEAKFAKLDKYFSDDTEAKVMLSEEKGRQTIETSIYAGRQLFRAQDTSMDVFGGVDAVVGKLAGQMSKFKKKLVRKHKDAFAAGYEDLPDMEADAADTKITRTKKFVLHPMDPEEAVMQMEILNHNFFVFLNMDTGSVGVVYKRSGGDYGLLDTEV